MGSDGEVVLPMYSIYDSSFSKWLDGEFAIAVFDLERGRATLSTDIFSTKPLWYSRHQGLRVASYKSGVERMGAPPHTIHMVDPNTVLIFGLTVDPATGAVPLLAHRAVYEFDLRQFKTDTSDFIRAFEAAG